jgi:hypothetical protein
LGAGHKRSGKAQGQGKGGKAEKPDSWVLHRCSSKR